MDAKKRTIFIGDIHGCSREFIGLLGKLNYRQSEDRLILLGDVINRGPDSVGVLSLIKKYQPEVLLGNHELGFLEYIKNKRLPVDIYFEDIIDQVGSELGYWIKWMEQLPLFIDDKDFIAVHAGIIPNIGLDKIPANIITRVRTWNGQEQDMNNRDDLPWYELYKEKKKIVYGHWAEKGLTIRENTVGIDTGCLWGEKLTAYILESQTVVQFSSEKEYANKNDF